MHVMKGRNLLSALLTVLLVVNASCACAAMVVDVEAGAHAHHQQASQDTAADADCHSDCEDCAKAAGVGLGKDTGQPASFKFGLDDIDWSAVAVAPYRVNGATRTTHPPPGPSFQAAATPVRRFDLQLE